MSDVVARNLPGAPSRAATALLLVLISALTVVGCQAEPSSPPTTQSPLATALGSVLGDLPPTDLEEARRFRTDFGLRSDDAWIRQVAADPTANRTAYGVPLTVGEIGELDRRNRTADQIRDWVIGYGEHHPDEWAGAFIDQHSGGALVAQFTGHLETHRLALFAHIWPKANLEVRQVRWPQSALEALRERVEGDEAWMAAVPADVRSLGIDIVGNRVVLEISSPIPTAAQLILEHFGGDAAPLSVASDGNGGLLIPPGILIVKVTDAAGAPRRGLACVAYPDAGGASNPRPDPVPTTDASGICRLSVRATGYWVVIEDPQQPQSALAFGRAVVGSGDPAEITIVVH